MNPGGTQLLSKRLKMYLPEIWSTYYSKAKGCEYGIYMVTITMIFVLWVLVHMY